MSNQNGSFESGGNNGNSGTKYGFSEGVKLCINLLTHFLIFTVVIFCLWFAFSSEKIGIFQLHIIFCVLGYQFLMCQGTLVLVQYNVWTKLLSRKTNKSYHVLLQIFAVVFIVTGSSLMYSKQFNLQSAHGIFAFLALITTLISLINGIRRINFYRCFHYLTGNTTLYLSAISLCFGLNVSSFKKWSAYEDIIAYFLMAFTIIFTTLVSFEFFITRKNMLAPNYEK